MVAPCVLDGLGVVRGRPAAGVGLEERRRVLLYLLHRQCVDETM